MSKLPPGTTVAFSVLTGEVINTTQRSDTYTTGRSQTIIYNGSGGGSGHVTSEVVITTDIWFRDNQNQERHVRAQADIPVRVGQRIALVYIKAERPASRQSIDELFSVYVLPTNRFFRVRGEHAIATALVAPNWSTGTQLAYLALWAATFAACIGIFGIPIAIGLWIISKVREANRRKLASELAIAIEAEHQPVIDAANRTFQLELRRLAEIAETRRLASGAVA